jgi:hypothetical protein
MVLFHEPEPLALSEMKAFKKPFCFLVYKSDRGSSFMNFEKITGLQNLNEKRK